MKILNLYAGIGGNRKLWGNEHEITAIEYEPKIAAIYSSFFPNDKVIIADAHQFLLEHYKEFDFIWSSPPCPTHSTFERLHFNQGYEVRFPDMKLYEEIIFLREFFKGKFVIENVISYYEPLIKPWKIGRHYYWTNFPLVNIKEPSQNIKPGDSEAIEIKQKALKIDLSHLDITQDLKNKVLNNCVNSEVALHIFELAFKKPQLTL